MEERRFWTKFDEVAWTFVERSIPSKDSNASCCYKGRVNDPYACSMVPQAFISWGRDEYLLYPRGRFSRCSLGSALAKIREYDHYDHDPDGGCRMCAKRISNMLSGFVKRREAIRGVCLECLKSKKQRAGDCRITHEGFLGAPTNKRSFAYDGKVDEDEDEEMDTDYLYVS